MPIDRKLKQKRKRQQKHSAARQSKDRRIRHEKAEEFSWRAADAFDAGDYQQAYTWALQGLKLYPRNQMCYDIAVECSARLKDADSTFTILQHGWSHGLLKVRQHALVLANHARVRAHHALTIDVLETLLEDRSAFTGRLSRQERQEVQGMLSFCRTMEKKRAPLSRPCNRQESPLPAGPPPNPHVPHAAPPLQASAEAVLKQAHEPLPELAVVFAYDEQSVVEVVRAGRASGAPLYDLTLSAYKFSFRTSYDHLICLPILRNVQSLWYQEETVRKVMRTFRGRAILADEVGLGKTVEACIVLKEYIMRGLVRSALILVPSSLVKQWQDELQDKVDLAFVSSNDVLFRDDPQRFWQEPFLLVSLQTARSKGHFNAVTGRSYDMLIVDEAHHLKNRATQNWKLVNTIRNTFMLLLTATPVQNNLEELYNLVTLLKPGHLKTRKAFTDEFVSRGNPTDPRNREKLRGLLQEVMIRNTRSVTQLNLPPRFASTVRVAPAPAEALFYAQVSGFVTQAALSATGIPKLAMRKLLEAAGSSHRAALSMLANINSHQVPADHNQVAELVEIGRTIGEAAKLKRIIELVQASSEKIIIFVNYIATLEYLGCALQAQGIPHAVYRGGLTPAQKQQAIDSFRDGCRVLLSTETGGEGHNMQFCHTMINYDLPWNPMQIEQRIGRIHRIGQEQEVTVYNFCSSGTIEDYILEVLDRKINMFELVVGEIDMILGRLKDEREFSDLVYDLWVSNAEAAGRQRAFEELAARLQSARQAHEKTKKLDEALFKENYEA